MSYLTEEQAREKWCPFARVRDWTAQTRKRGVPENATASNRVDDGLKKGAHCIASDCAAWRWNYDFINSEESHGEDWEKVAVVTSYGRAIYRWKRTAGGYCGLATKPEGS